MSFITKEYYKNKENHKKAIQISQEIADCLRQTGKYDSSCVILAAYLLNKVSQYKNPLNITLKAIFDGFIGVNDNVRYMAREHFSDITWEQLLQLVTKYSAEQFALAAIIPVSENDIRGVTMTTPDSIIKLVHKLLNVNSDDRVADICCGRGDYLISAALEENGASYYGYEINVKNSTVVQARAELIDGNIQVDICDVFNLVKDNYGVKFDKIFSNYPFGMRLKNLGAGVEYAEKLSKRYSGLSKATSSDWIFNALLCDLLAENGKAIGIMTNGSTWNSIDIPMRKFFVERKMVECVISLPNRMFSFTNIPTTLIVFSHNNNSVRMVDATGLCQQGRRQNEFDDKNIAEIVEALSVDSGYSKKVSIEELRANEYNLNLNRYLSKKITFTNGVSFGSVIKSISRGAPCTASQLDEMVTESVTNMQYLMLSNIQNGIIDDKLPYLSFIDPKYEKYCLKNDSLILSKNGYPYKIAVAAVEEGHHILANGNLYIIELDKERANPYYIKAFFDSEQGQAVLKSITVGATIPNIGVDKLRKIEIPLPTMAEQERIAQKYRATLDEISVIKLRLEKAHNKLKHIFDEEGE